MHGGAGPLESRGRRSAGTFSGRASRRRIDRQHRRRDRIGRSGRLPAAPFHRHIVVDCRARAVQENGCVFVAGVRAVRAAAPLLVDGAASHRGRQPQLFTRQHPVPQRRALARRERARCLQDHGSHRRACPGRQPRRDLHALDLGRTRAGRGSTSARGAVQHLVEQQPGRHHPRLSGRRRVQHALAHEACGEIYGPHGKADQSGGRRRQFGCVVPDFRRCLERRGASSQRPHSSQRARRGVHRRRRPG